MLALAKHLRARPAAPPPQAVDAPPAEPPSIDVPDPAPSPTPRPALAGASGHNPALDGFRAVAILLVIVTHASVFIPATPLDHLYVNAARLGRLGVDMFFVLSGFLITGILADAKATPGQTARPFFLNFYARRTVRIFPLYYAVLTLAFVIIPNLDSILGLLTGHAPWAERAAFSAQRFAGPKHDAPWYWLYASNIPIARDGEWPPSFLFITWSLAIEEQFYLLWPLLVWLLSPRAALRTSLALVGVSVTARAAITTAAASYAPGTAPPFINTVAPYTLTPCRFDALALGSALALALRGAADGWTTARAARLARPTLVVSALALPALLYADHALDLDGPDGFSRGPIFQTAGYLAVALFNAALLALALDAAPGSRFARFWSARPLRTVGKYTYALFLLHMPVLTVVAALLFGPRTTPGARFPLVPFFSVHGSQLPAQLLFFPLGVAACLGAAWLSWHLIESPALRLKRFFPSGYERRG